MKKISLLVVLGMSALVLGSGLTVNAASEGVIEKELTQKDTMKFEIKAGDTDEVKTPDPIIDGGEPETVKPGPVIPHKGNLAITMIPQLNFGEIKLGGKATTAYQGIFESKPYKYEDEKGAVIDEDGAVTKYKPAVRVDDLRGTNAGWNLKISLDKIMSGETELKGAVLNYPVNTIRTDNVKDSGADLEGSLSSSVTLSSDNQPASLMAAAKGTGRGGNQVTYFFGTKDDTQPDGYKRDHKKEINLTVPSGSIVGQYQADVTYQLSELAVQNGAD